jgi:hypothetical protein
MAKGQATKAAATKAADSNGDVDPKVQKAAFDIRKQGGTAAIASHTLGISYGMAQRLVAEYDKAHGNHGPSKLIRNADGITLPGWTVRDGRAAAPAKKKAATKKAATKAKSPKAAAAQTA